MFKLMCLLTSTLCATVVHSWDLAYTVKNQIEIYSEEIVKRIEGSDFQELTALTYDSINNMFYFVDRYNNDTSIFSYNLVTGRHQPLVKQKLPVIHFVQGIAVDPVTSKLFWTDTTEYSIFWISLKPGVKNDVYGNLLIKMENKITPRGIAVDSCRGYVYWTSTNSDTPTIEKIRFDGTDRQVIVDTDMNMLVSITVDQKTKKIYWTDERGIFYTIESSDLDGGNRKKLVSGRYHMPNGITVTEDSIFWVDWALTSIWKVPINASLNVNPIAVRTFDHVRPYGIVAKYPIADQINDVPECVNLLETRQTELTPYFFNISTDSNELCLHGVKDEGNLSCKCIPGYTGKYCEVPYLDNSTQELVNKWTTTNSPIRCNCTDEVDKNAPLATEKSITSFTNVSSSSCRGNWDPIRDPIIVVLSTAAILLLVVCIVLLIKIPRHVNMIPLISLNDS